MNRTPAFRVHCAAVTALFILGCGVITLPTSASDEYTVAVFLLSAVISLLICFLLYKPANLLFGEKAPKSYSLPGKITAAAVYTAVAVYSLFCFAKSFKTFIRFAADLLLKNGALWVAVLVFGAVSLFFATRRQEDILKFALLSFVCALAVMVLFVLAPLNNYEIRNIFVYRFPDFNTVWKNFKPYLTELCLPTILLPIYHALVFRQKHKGSFFWGVALGNILLGICITSAVLLFGPLFAARIEYPYAAAVSTVSVGRLFTRMDYFSYFIYFVSSITKITLCLFTAKECLKRMSVLCKPR